MKVSGNIRRYRKRLNLTQKELGEKLNKVESTVRMWELGKTEPPLTTAIQLADIFGVTLDELVGRTILIVEGKGNERD